MAAKTESNTERRPFRATQNVILAGVTHPPGTTVELTRDEFELLRANGAIEHLDQPKPQEVAKRGFDDT